jgi:hypothetical protein
VSSVAKLKLTRAPSAIAFVFMPETSQLFSDALDVLPAVRAGPITDTVIGPVADDVTIVALQAEICDPAPASTAVQLTVPP